jgi:hypothetical protein
MVMVVFSSCNIDRCPPDEFIGTITVSERSKRLLPYEGVTGLVFKNSHSKEIRLVSSEGLNDSYFSVCAYKPCNGLFKGETCQNVDMETREITFENDSIKLNTRVFWELPNDNGDELDTSFIETIETVVRQNTEQVRTQFLSNSKGVSLDDEYMDHFSVDTLDQVTLIDSVFSDVYNKDDLMWFSEGSGLIGFIWQNKLYELKEILR